MKTLIFGNGWLGNQFASHFDCRVSQVDILDCEAVADELLESRPDVVINAAGKCGRPNIDWCEASEDNKRLTKYVNTYGPVVLYHMVEGVSHRLHRKMEFVHLSSGCLWEWGKDLDENVVPEPPSYYSWTKAEGEKRLPLERCLVVRLRMPLSGIPHPRNLFTKLAGYMDVLDTSNSVTAIEDLLPTVEKLVKKKAHGVYNVVNPGVVSPAEIMRMYAEIVDINHCFRIATVEELKQRGIIRAGRSNVTLSTEKLKGEGIELPEAKSRIRELLHIYKERVA